MGSARGQPGPWRKPATPGDTVPQTVPSGVARAAGSLGQWFQARFGANMQRGEPPPLGHNARRRPRWSSAIPFGTARYTPLPHYDWGAAGYAYRGGRVFYNPIGGGIVYTRQLRPEAGAVLAVQNGVGIYWSSQMINAGAQPELGPLYSPSYLAALLGPIVSQAAVPSGTSGIVPNAPTGAYGYSGSL